MHVITILEAREEEKKEKRIILDVRTPDIYRKNHVRNAVNIPYDEIEIGEYYLADEYCYLLYCERGILSMSAARILEEDHFQVKSVIGGMTAYRHLEEWNDSQRKKESD